MLRTLVVTLAVGLALLAGPATAGPLDHPGYAKAMTCSACHGFAGNSGVEAVPILAGLTPAYFKKAIEDYATGKRISPEMEPFAKQVKLLGVDEIAAYFAAQRRDRRRSAPIARAVERGRAAGRNAPPVTGRRGRAIRPSSSPRSPVSRRCTSATSSCCSRPISGAPATPSSTR